MATITGIEAGNVAKRSMPGNTILPAYAGTGLIYHFEDETTAESSDWVPANNWVNGASAVDGTYWGRSSNKTVSGLLE